MADTTMEKIYCYDRPDNNCAEMWAMMNGNNAWMNNPFMYLIWLAFFGGNGFGGWGNGNTELSSKLDSILNQMTDNHANTLAMNAIQGNGAALHELAGNLNLGVSSLSAAVHDVQNAILAVGASTGMGAERVINSIVLGNKDLMQLLSQCCCDNKQLVTLMGYEGQIRDLQNTGAITNRLDALDNDLTKSFAATAYETAQLTCALLNSLRDLTSTILQRLDAIETAGLKDKIAELQETKSALMGLISQEQQNQTIHAMIAPLLEQINAIRSALPATVSVLYPQLTAVPNYVAYGYNNGISPFWN